MFLLKRLKHWSRGNIANENEGSMMMMTAAFRLEQSDFNELIFWFPTFPAEGYETIWNRFVIVFGPSASLPLTTICHFIFISKIYQATTATLNFWIQDTSSNKATKKYDGSPLFTNNLILVRIVDRETRRLEICDDWIFWHWPIPNSTTAHTIGTHQIQVRAS